MKNLLIKEIRLASSPLSWFFLAGALMTLLPGYPILMGAFFVCFGIFREANDVLYTVLLPVEKSGLVKSKFAFTCLIQAIGFLLCAALTALRMTVLSKAEPYVGNALMNATPVFLAFVLLIFSAFNFFFVAGFFKTAYKIGMPFLSFGIAAFCLVLIAETLPHLPSLEFLHAPEGKEPLIQFYALGVAVLLYAALTFFAFRLSVKRFEKLDL